MGSVNIDFLKRDDTTKPGFLYSDIHMDLQNDYKVRANFGKAKTQLIDVKISYDVEAVFNSLTALFNTNRGERLLLPEYGIDLRSLLFQPVSDGVAEIIGQSIKDGIDRWEPRVYLNLVTIEPIPDDHVYIIELELTIPSLKSTVVFGGSILQGEGFVRG